VGNGLAQVPEGDDARPKELVGQGAMLIAQITIPKVRLASA